MPYKIHMPKQETEYFLNKLKSCNEYLEYGSGGSTYFASSIPNLKAYSVESDKDFKNKLEEDIRNNPERKNNPKLYHVDIGKTVSWGHPSKKTFESKKHLFKNYPLSVWNENPDLNPELIFIDGRFRVACFLTILKKIKRKTTVMIDDYKSRIHYHVCSKISKPIMIGRMAVFELTPNKNYEEELKSVEYDSR